MEVASADLPAERIHIRFKDSTYAFEAYLLLKRKGIAVEQTSEPWGHLILHRDALKTLDLKGFKYQELKNARR